MDFYLKDTFCENCSKESIVVVPFKESRNSKIVSHGTCVNCGQNIILPQEKYYKFIIYNCLKGDKLEKNDVISACFTGHRPEKLGGYNLYSDRNIVIGKKVREVILKLYHEHGVRRFISGGSQGMDLMSAAIIRKLKMNDYDDIELVIAIPFREQPLYWKDEGIDKYLEILQFADKLIFVDELVDTKYYCDLKGLGVYHPRKMYTRNMFMVDFSNYLLALWNGDTKGGTFNCVQYAQKQNIDIVRLNPNEI